MKEKKVRMLPERYEDLEPGEIIWGPHLTEEERREQFEESKKSRKREANVQVRPWKPAEELGVPMHMRVGPDGKPRLSAGELMHKRKAERERKWEAWRKERGIEPLEDD